MASGASKSAQTKERETREIRNEEKISNSRESLSSTEYEEEQLKEPLEEQPDLWRRPIYTIKYYLMEGVKYAVAFAFMALFNLHALAQKPEKKTIIEDKSLNTVPKIPTNEMNQADPSYKN